MLRRRPGAGRPGRRTALPGPRATLARGSAPGHPCAESPPGSPICPFRGCPCRGLSYLLPPFRFAFFSKLSYWCDMRCAWIWAMKSITTTTTISSEVPPK